MGFLDALKGGGNRDAMRQTTSLTMAYLLEQNARFEAFMRQKVDELEAIVAQQQARHAEVDPASEEIAEPEPWPEPEEGEVEPAATELVQTDTRPARPVTSYFDDFTLDDLAPAPEGASEVFVSVAEPAGVDAPSPGDTQLLARVTPTPEPEPASPPDWQTLLLSDPSSTGEPIPEAAEMVEEPAGGGTIESAAAEGEAVKEARTDVDTMEKGESPADEPIPEAREAVDETASLLPAWLRRQQQAMLDPTGGEQSPEVGQEAAPSAAGDQTIIETAGEETAVLAGTNAGADDKTGEPAVQEAGTVITKAEDEGEWDMALDKQGPAGDWE
jgi:hypothetical protein